MEPTLIGSELTPAEGETVLRSYHCTSTDPLLGYLGLQNHGFLTVTNKRLVWFARGVSLGGIAGSSKRYQNLPIEDVANVAVGNGTRFSVLRLLSALILSSILAGMLALLASQILFALERDGAGQHPYLLRFVLWFQFATALLVFTQSLAFPRDGLSRLLLASISAGLLSPAALGPWAPVQLVPPDYLRVMTVLAVPVSCYSLWCLYWFIRREYLTLTIFSRSGFSAPIRVRGVSWWSRINVAAGFASFMAPAADAQRLFKELGALLADVHTSGDQAVSRWLKPEPEAIEAIAPSTQRGTAPQQFIPRWAAAMMMAAAGLVAIESVWYASEVNRALAMQVREEMANARRPVEGDASIRALLPRMLKSAQDAAAAGESAFTAKRFTDAMAYWRDAINTYSSIPSVAAAFRQAATLESKNSIDVAALYFQENAAERLTDPALLRGLDRWMSQHPATNEPWATVQKSTRDAKGFGEAEEWLRSGVAWTRAESNLPQAVRLMRADIWVKRAEIEIKRGDAGAALGSVGNALQLQPRYPPAVQRQKLAANMVAFDQWRSGAIEEAQGTALSGSVSGGGLDQAGGKDWTLIKDIIQRARGYANQDDWERCNQEWEAALGKTSAVMLFIRLTRLEIEARRGNWAAVVVAANKVLMDHPDHARATGLKQKAEAIESARARESEYRQALLTVLEEEVRQQRLPMGDLKDLNAHMDRYGREEWARVKDAIAKAGAFRTNEQGIECANEWTRAREAFPSAVERMRSEIWLERAEVEAKGTNWVKALLYAQRALNEKSDHGRARQLRDEADAIEAERLRGAVVRPNP